MKKAHIIIFVFILIFCTACNERNPISVYISDATLKGCSDITFSVKYTQEKDYKEKYTDVYIKPSKDNLAIIIKQEYKEPCEIIFPSQNEYYSLTKLIANKNESLPEFNKYSEMITVNYIINSSEDCNLIIKAVVGDISEYKTNLINIKDVSKEFVLKVKKFSK